MSRSGYSEDCENINLYRATVDRATNGKRGQAFLRELLSVLDVMPEKRLISDELVDHAGEFCALGVVGCARGMDLKPSTTRIRMRLPRRSASLAASLLRSNSRTTTILLATPTPLGATNARRQSSGGVACGAGLHR